MADLLSIEDLPEGFVYSSKFIRVVELGLTNLEPWLVMQGESLRERYEGLRKRFPGRTLVPFARRLDNDDVACWDVGADPERVVVVHDFAAPGWEVRGEFVDFNDWLRQAIEDLITFD